MDAPIDYHIAQYADKPDRKKNMNSSEVYLVAAHREWNSYNFYKGLAEVQPAGEVQGDAAADGQPGAEAQGKGRVPLFQHRFPADRRRLSQHEEVNG